MLPIINTLLPMVGEVLDRVVPDKNLNAKTKSEIEKMLIANAAQINVEQIKTNQIEAGHRSVWTSGWRPSLGWACSAGFAYTFILQPILQWILVLVGNDTILPSINTDILLELVFAMLGLAGLRSYDKMKGTTK